MGERLIRLEDPAKAEALFENWQETLIWSALEGEMGCIWTVSDEPGAALCENGDFLFLAGAAEDPETLQLLECWKQEKGGFGILALRDEACGALIRQVFGANVRSGKRMAFHKTADGFCLQNLQAMLKAAPEEISIVPFDRGLCEQARQNDWSVDFVSQFRGTDDFLRRGLGFGALHGGELVGGASSYIRYSSGIEIQVETRADWQRRGIASACCAALILECMKRGLYPSWDAANPASSALARKLGYREAGMYTVWY